MLEGLNLFSVLMSVYAGENPAYFEEALESIQNQSLRCTEFVLVCDGPLTPALDSVIDRFRDVFDFQLVRLPVNVGLGRALHEGLLACKFDFIVRCDSDDICHPDRFATLLNAAYASSDDVAVIGSFVCEFNLTENSLILRQFPSVACRPGTLVRDAVAHPAVLLKKACVIEAGGYLDCLYFEDTYLWLRLFKAGFKVVNLPFPLVHMRTSEDFFARRSGFRYAKFEIMAFWLFSQRGLINGFGLCMGFCRAFIRLFPRNFVISVYKRFFR